METVTRKNNYGVSFGLISGLIICIVTLVQYLGGINSYLSPIGYISYVIMIIMAVLAGLRQRKSNGEYLEFGEALKVTFTVFALALLLQTIFTYILLNFIDPSFKQAVAQEVINKTESIMRRFGASDSQIEEAMDTARNKDSFSLGSMLLGYGLTCIVAFIIALIISAIIKRSKPVFPNS